MAKFFRGDKRRREMDRKRRSEEKQRRLQVRRDMRARGLDPDVVDAEGNPLPPREGDEDAAADADEPVAALAALVDRVIDQRFAALTRLAHTRQIGGGGLMADPVTVLLVSSSTVLRAIHTCFSVAREPTPR